MNLILGCRSWEIVAFDLVCSFISSGFVAFGFAGIGETTDNVFVRMGQFPNPCACPPLVWMQY